MPAMAPPPPPASAPRKSGGILDRLFSGGGGGAGRARKSDEPAPARSMRREMAKDADDAKAEERGHMTRAGSLDLSGGKRGIVRVHRDGELVVEVEIDEALDFKLPAQIAVLFAGAGFTMIDVVVAKSTASGKIPAGTRIRLVLKVDRLPSHILHPDFLVNLAGT
jgi:hypothetical protein